MAWNIAPECISLVILIIIWIYSRKSNLTPTLRNILFQGCFLTTMIGISTNILSTLLIAQRESAPAALTWIVTSIYFVFTPLMGLVYSFYSASVIYEKREIPLKTFVIWGFPGLLYIGLILINPFTKLIFDFTSSEGYRQGPLVSATYIIFYFYCLQCVYVAVRNRKSLDSHVYHILSLFPFTAVFVIIVQQFYPSVILSGSAAACALLIIYLYLQNRQISIDFVTDLPNRLELLEMLDLLLKKKTKAFSLCVVSLRDFKHINDSFGQQTGDFLLKKIGQYLSSVCGEKSVFRFKGDEFALLISEDNLSELNRYIQQILKRLSFPWTIRDADCTVACSIGIVNYPETTYTLETIILAVEDAVTRAKKDGVNSVCYFDKEMFAHIQRKKEIIQILKDKLAAQDFELFYQPIVSLETGRFEYAESLMRINDSRIGFISPGEFIPIAEETGMIVDITYILLDKVCKFIRHMLTLNLPLTCVHVNFSALQFRQPELSEKVLNIIAENHIPTSSIKIEFTESTVAESTESVTSFAVEMAKHGIFMGLDDFGMGYSNLSTVITIPFSTIKLDKSLVWAATKERRTALTIRNIIRTFKDLNMKVVAEGVETEEQRQFIMESGADQIQGFYYAKPMSAADIEQFLIQQQTSNAIPT